MLVIPPQSADLGSTSDVPHGETHVRLLHILRVGIVSDDHLHLAKHRLVEIRYLFGRTRPTALSEKSPLH